MRQDQAIQLYRAAVDPTMGEEQGAQWWADVCAELAAVVAAPDTKAAAVIKTWERNEAAEAVHVTVRQFFTRSLLMQFRSQ